VGEAIPNVALMALWRDFATALTKDLLMFLKIGFIISNRNGAQIAPFLPFAP
jgi:hypothetical protein